MFKGQKPPAQPRSLRSEAEGKGTDPKKFPPGGEVDITIEAPQADSVDSASLVPKPRGKTAADPTPFANLRGKK